MTATPEARVAEPVSTRNIAEALRETQQRRVSLVGALGLNQGRPTITGRLSLEALVDLSVVHNKRWIADAGESIDLVTQRELKESHVTGLAIFILQGLVDATIRRVREQPAFPSQTLMALNRIADRLGCGNQVDEGKRDAGHYGIPQFTFVLPETEDLDVTQFRDQNGEMIAARYFLPAGRLFVTADGQHRREAARRVREFLTETIANRRTPKNQKFYSAEDAPLSADEVDAWVLVQETFRSYSTVSYEVHLNLTVPQARQMFTNFNAKVLPVKPDLNLEFDSANPINQFGKQEVVAQLPKTADGKPILDLRQVAAINGFLFLGKSSIKQAPYNVDLLKPKAREFWTTVFQSVDWRRPDSYLREVAILKGLAKAWFYVHFARRNRHPGRDRTLREYIRTTKFDNAWVEEVPDLKLFVIQTAGGGGSIRFQPAHNEIVACIVDHVIWGKRSK